MINALEWIKSGFVANDNRFLVIKFYVIQKFCEKMTGTLKSPTDFKIIRLLRKWLQYHESLNVKSANHDLSRSRNMLLQYLKTNETPYICSIQQRNRPKSKIRYWGISITPGSNTGGFNLTTFLCILDVGNNKNLYKTNIICWSLDIRYCGVQLSFVVF